MAWLQKTLDNRTLSIPCNEIIRPGYTKLISGEGMPLPKNPAQKGDLIIKFDVVFPTYLSEDKRRAIKQILES